MRIGAVGDGIALVFECELTTFWIPTANGGAVIRNAHPETLAEANALIATVTTWKQWPHPIALRDGRIFFFDSAMAGAADPSTIDDEPAIRVARARRARDLDRDRR